MPCRRIRSPASSRCQSSGAADASPGKASGGGHGTMVGRRIALVLGAVMVAGGPAAAHDPGLVENLVIANRILYDQGVVDGFGHISARLDHHPEHFLLARSMAPGLVTTADVMEHDRDGEPVDAQGRTPYLERFIHSEIYKAHPEIMAIVHSHSPAVIPFGVVGTPLKPIYHMSSFLGGHVPVFEIRDTGGPATDMLIRT